MRMCIFAEMRLLSSSSSRSCACSQHGTAFSPVDGIYHSCLYLEEPRSAATDSTSLTVCQRRYNSFILHLRRS